MGTDEQIITETTEKADGATSTIQSSLNADDLLVDADSPQAPILSVVMPTLNEEAGIAECIDQIKTAIETLGVPTEIIISDSSTDRTPEIAREQGAIVVEPDEPGYGSAYRYAFEQVRGDYIAMGDADTTYDFEQIPRLLEPILDGDADIVMGNRLDGEIKAGAMPTLHQYIGNPLLTKFLNTFYDAGVGDAHSGFRVFTHEALEEMELQTSGMEFASEMIMDAGARDLNIEEKPIVYHERKGDETLDSFRDGWRHVRFMLLNAPGYLFSIPGLLFGLAGLVLLTLAATDITLGGASFGNRTMIAGSLSLLVGFQVGSFGIFSTVGSDPIRQPSDPLTGWIVDNLTLERGVTVGVGLFIAGAAYAGWRLYTWSTQGYMSLSSLAPDLLGFTAIVLGIQVTFSAFLMSTLAGLR